jgi:hypothetical protein
MRQEVAYAPPPPEVDWCTGTEADMIVTDLDTGVYMRPEGAHGEKLLIGSIEPECDEPYCHPRAHTVHALLHSIRALF